MNGWMCDVGIRIAVVELYFYRPSLSPLMDPSWWQSVTCFVVIETCFLDSDQAACLVVRDLGWRVARAGGAQEHRDAIANPRNRDCRC